MSELQQFVNQLNENEREQITTILNDWEENGYAGE